jgi:hypothetical protein
VFFGFSLKIPENHSWRVCSEGTGRDLRVQERSPRRVQERSPQKARKRSPERVREKNSQKICERWLLAIHDRSVWEISEKNPEATVRELWEDKRKKAVENTLDGSGNTHSSKI